EALEDGLHPTCLSGTHLDIFMKSSMDKYVRPLRGLSEQSWSYITSGSGQNWRSLPNTAFGEELITHPKKRISQHLSRIVDEMDHDGPDENTSTTIVIPYTCALLSYNISHYILTPRIATAITTLEIWPLIRIFMGQFYNHGPPLGLFGKIFVAESFHTESQHWHRYEVSCYSGLPERPWATQECT
ncbi:hypothetical protein N7540_009937, partial [Penicillium herquei]